MEKQKLEKQKRKVMKFNGNSSGIFKKNRNYLSQLIAVCLLIAIFAANSRISVQAAPIIDTTASQTSVIPSAYNVQTSSLQNTTGVQMVSAQGSTSAMAVSIPGTANGQAVLTSEGTGTQMTQTAAALTVSPMVSSGAGGVGELWMLGSSTGAQNLSIVIKSPHGKLIVIDGGWEADADKLSSLILQQGGKVDAWLITHPHEDHVGALCTILNDSSRKIKIDKIYCSLATPDWYRQVSPSGAGIANQLLNAFTKLPVGTVTNNIGRGTEINIDDVNIRVLNNRGVYTYNGVNNSSLVYKIRVSGQSILILGDLAYDGGKDLIKTCSAAELKSDIVQMAHHGQQGVDQDAYALIAPTTCLWPSPAWLWNNDNGGGVGSGPWGTLTTRAWMDALGVKDNRSLKDGDVHMYLGMPSPNM